VALQTARRSVVTNMTEPMLRAVIAESKVSIPQNAARDELVDLAVKCRAGELKPGTVVETTPPGPPPAREDPAGAASDEIPGKPAASPARKSRRSA
jgi:hypothetical protein